MARAQSIVHREGKLLMAQHQLDGRTWWALPGGSVEEGESPAEAALRELREECCVDGIIIRETSRWSHSGKGETQTFLIDIGDQIPSLGHDPEVAEGTQKLVLIDIQWLHLSQIPERDRAFLWAAGLLGVDEFFPKVLKWGNALSYPMFDAPDGEELDKK